MLGDDGVCDGDDDGDGDEGDEDMEQTTLGVMSC